MSYIAKPKVTHPKIPRNNLGLTVRDYEGAVSTLCAGCGHDSITAALIQAVFELGIEPHRLAKMSGIGCSSKTPAYFVSQSHGFNSVHGRMPSVTTGANAANHDLTYIGVSGDGDSLSIGMGQFAHVIRRNLNMCYIIENNGVYGLTKGQYSASADVGTKAKKGPANKQMPIDPVSTAIGLGATYIARGFSGDKQQLVPLIKGALTHKGFALLDIISPCVTFNDHEGSTKSYSHTRRFYHHVIDTDFVPPAAEIKAAYDEGEAMPVELHDGSKIVFRKLDRHYDPTSRAAAFTYLRDSVQRGEIITGLLYIDHESGDMHNLSGSVDKPLASIPYQELNPGKEMLAKVMSRYR
ncbi:MAG: 2-oxoacid:ferredoxin oxidoreductase subunit beta [Gammaproteobacteria bacterium]|nr:2-oxoacid:ferredoxin oxidoreductase subunit beta [Gammaproteobacteria bacterium]MDH4313426.1 2-oxoacid:ferredoxin oxidoreductase subunit beta [Gammaproteobacteria bacterium]MDH5214053.1 2-oxoacid:ferredoxin oxidoreductase subunit beta [Gammaproteobacteria bacterium]MDH5501772.1 2-oxoacid:ferredoxin oxidoreductase subunit beta [Gammaproteobacteria bacterium]